MSLGFNAFGGNVLGLTNATADTVVYAVVPGRPGFYTRVAMFQHVSGNTANSSYLLRPIGRANLASAAATSQAVVIVDAHPYPTGNTIASGDQVVVREDAGTYTRYQVSSYNGTTKAITFTANVATALSAGNKLWNFGVFTDTDPAVATAHPLFPTTANTTTTVTFGPGGVSGHQKGDPILFYNPNATNATKLNHLEYAYTRS